MKKNTSEVHLVEIISMALELNKFEAVFNVPGFGGTEVLESLKNSDVVKTFVNLNEEAAFSISYGVSSNEKRSALLIKSQGFTKAMNAITSSLSTEIPSANLILIFDDTEGKSSDNILPTKQIVKSSEIPFYILGNEPSKEIAIAIRKSENLKLPVAIIIDCKMLSRKFSNKKEIVKQKKIKKSNFLDRLACPVLTGYQREKLKRKLSGESQKKNAPKIDNIKDVLPMKLLSEFSKYEKFMNIFKKYRPAFVSGDAGTSALFAFSPFNTIDTCTYMGGGPGMALGALIAGNNESVCVTGDFSFFAAGILGFNEAVIHNLPLKLILFSNGKAHATGGQELNPVLLKSFRRSYYESITDIKLETAKESQIVSSLINFLKKDGLSVLILEV